MIILHSVVRFRSFRFLFFLVFYSHLLNKSNAFNFTVIMTILITIVNRELSSKRPSTFNFMIPTLPFVKPKQCSFSKTFFLLFLFFLSLSLSLSLCLVVINNRSLKCQFLLCSRSCCTTSTSDDRPLLPYCSGNLSKLLHRLHSAQRQQKSDVDVLLRLQFRSFRLWVQQQLQQYCIFCRGKLDLGKCHLCCVIISSESYRCRVIHRLQECNHRCMPAVFIFIFFFHSSLRDSSSKRKHNYCHCHEFFFFFFTAITFLLI